MSSINLLPVSCSRLAQDLKNNGSNLLLVDTRPSAQHSCKHIKPSENINFSNILLRRLLKGVVQLNTMIPSKELEQRLSQRDSSKERLVVYDANSRQDCVRAELLKHAEVLAKTDLRKESDNTVYFLDGGFEAFSAHHSNLCAAGKKAHSPLGISVSASLPIFSNIPSSAKRSTFSKLQTPSEDTCSQFGPPVEILPHLVLGCAKDSSNLTQLRKRGVTAVLNVSHNCPNHFESILEYKSIEVQDSYQADLLSKMESAIDYINAVKAKNGCVFVHCHAGISRSATICIAYIMKTMQWDLSKAYEFVKERRPCISPNLHFMGQLLEFQKLLQVSSASGIESVEEETDTNVEMERNATTYTTSTTCNSHYFDVALTTYEPQPMEEEEDCEETRTLISASAPSSLNFDNDRTSATIAEPTQVKSELTRTKATKPKTLPLFKKSKSHCIQTKKDKLDLELKREKPRLCSLSLPNTPISQSKNHLPAQQTRSPLPHKVCHPLQFSPSCGMAATLGSRSETSLNNIFHHTPLTESM